MRSRIAACLVAIAAAVAITTPLATAHGIAEPLTARTDDGAGRSSERIHVTRPVRPSIVSPNGHGSARSNRLTDLLPPIAALLWLVARAIRTRGTGRRRHPSPRPAVVVVRRRGPPLLHVV